MNYFLCQMMVEDDQAPTGVEDLAATVMVQVIDLDDSVLPMLREYDSGADGLELISSFSEVDPAALPKVAAVIPQIMEWIDAVAQERLNFYSAREEPDVVPKFPATQKKAAAKKTPKMTVATLTEQVAALQAQLQLMASQMQNVPKPSGGAAAASGVPNGAMIAMVPSLSSGLSPGTGHANAAKLVGPPPKSKPPAEFLAPDVEKPAQPMAASSALGGGMDVVNAISQQSLAITQLVAHLAGGDPLMDLASGSGSAGLSLSSKGVARREKMQADLANRSSTYFLQVQQQIFKRMNPSKPLPRTPEELALSCPSMCSYLEKQGGYKQSRETGLAMWLVGHAMDAAASDDFYATKEYLSLLAVALEQSVMDNGSWRLAYVLALLEDPPQSLFTDRMTPLSATGRPFGPMVPPQWAAVTLSYLREMDVLMTRKSEVKKEDQSKAKAADPGSPPSPKRKPRFPKKPKQGEESPSH